MIEIESMEHFQKLCKKKLVDWYNFRDNVKTFISIEDTFVVWACKTLQNYKALLSTTVDGDGVYVEYTYNGDKHELYEDVYTKVQNTYHTEE